MEKITWHKGEVIEGHKIGRTIGFPTINLDPQILPVDQEEGVYASLVRYKGKRYTGALYLGPLSVFGENKRVLEIYLLNFDRSIYGEEVSFSLVQHIRGLMELSSVEALEQQMTTDIEQIQGAVAQFKSDRRPQKT